MLNLAIGAFGFIGLLCFTIVRRRRSQAWLNNIPIAPTSEASFWWGHEYKAFANRIVNGEYLRWSLEVASVFRMKSALFQRDTIVVTDNVAVQHLLQNAYDYIKPPAMMPVVLKVVGRGLIWEEGDAHKKLRKSLSHAFSPAVINDMVEDVVKCADACVQRLHADIEAAGPNTPTNMTLYTSPCTLQVIARVGFGQDFPYDSPESIAINTGWRNDVEMFSTFAGFMAPTLLNLFPWITKLPVAALQEDGVARKTILDIGRKLIKQDKVNADGKDLFSLLFKDWTLTTDQLLDNIVTFLVAGHETTSATLNFTFLELAKQPECQSALRREVADVDVSDYATLDKLPYLDAMTREALRVFPSAKDTERVSLHDDVIPLQTPIKMLDGQIATSLPIKAGEHFVIPWTVMNVNPNVWGPDAHEFKPSRWIEPNGLPSSGLPRGVYSNLSTFADGPRSCIGWRLAVMELKIILAVLIKSFEFKATGVDITRKLSPGLTPFVNGRPGEMPLYISPVDA